MINFKLIKINLILNKFTQANFRTNSLIAILRQKKRKYFNSFRKIISTINNYITEFLQCFLKKKTTLKI